MIQFSDFQLNSKYKLNFVFGVNSLVDHFFKNIIKNMEAGTQAIVIDPKRTFNTDNQRRILVFRPLDLQDFILIISELNNYISSRLSKIIILDFPYFFRDYQGKSAKKVVINHRAFSACISILDKIASNNISIICGTYENTLSRNYPLFHKILKYYNYGSFKILDIEDSFFLLRQETGEITKVQVHSNSSSSNSSYVN